MSESSVTVNLHVDFSGFTRAVRRATRALERFAAGMRGAPIPPPFKTESGMTARQYRAARRRYAREMHSWRRDVAP